MTKYILIAAGVALLITSGTAYWLFAQNQALHESLATERANVVKLEEKIGELNDTVRRIEAVRARDQRELGRLSAELNRAQQEKERTVAQFNAYRDRLASAATEKPGLVGRLATRATGRVMHQFEQASGGGEQDQGDPPVPSAGTGADNADAGGNRGADAGGDEPSQ